METRSGLYWLTRPPAIYVVIIGGLCVYNQQNRSAVRQVATYNELHCHSYAYDDISRWYGHIIERHCYIDVICKPRLLSCTVTRM